MAEGQAARLFIAGAALWAAILSAPARCRPAGPARLSARRPSVRRALGDDDQSTSSRHIAQSASFISFSFQFAKCGHAFESPAEAFDSKTILHSR